jgi:hypothetical protein
MLVLVTKDLATFTKPLAWIGFILAIVLVLAMAFNSFPTLENMLPSGSDSHLDTGMQELKDFLYSSNFKDSIVFILSAPSFSLY